MQAGLELISCAYFADVFIERSFCNPDSAPMNQFLFKLIFGKPEHNLLSDEPVLQKHWKYLVGVWENDRHNDIGLERLLRLFLIAVQFLFPGIYIRHIFGNKGLTYKNLAIEVYVLGKLLFPLMVFNFELAHHPIFLFCAVYFLLETVLYIAALVFVSDMFSHTRSSNRAILLLLFNYIEITFEFAVMYRGFDWLDQKARTAIDFLYFSFVTSASLGYGDIHPVTNGGKLMVCAQSFIFLVFVVLFINFFSGGRNKIIR
jgi:hypothetical protein